MSETYKLDFGTNYKPDILSCLADLSNDEVFTPPEIANAMLDLLPKDIWTNPNIKILDPACKTGVFLREAAKRFIEGEKDIYPDLQERLDHIFHEQLYGIAITELTSLLTRRSLYCSKYASGPFSITKFNTIDGNIRYKNIRHTWKNGTCIFCGGSETQWNEAKRNGRELHAYDFIHTKNPEELFDMKFDVIISNPPYQLETDGAGKQARPIYDLFVNQAKKLNPRYLTMIIPSRWFSGGMGLDDFRIEMMNDDRLRTIVDYTNAKDCFPANSVSGGVCYFLWDRDNPGMCTFTNITGGIETTSVRSLNEFPVLVRYNKAIGILKKVLSKQEKSLADVASGLMPFGLNTSYRGVEHKTDNKNIVLHASNGVTYISKDEISKGSDLLDSYKVLVSKTAAEHAGEPGKDGRFRVIPSSMKVIGPNEACTHSYFLVGNYDKKGNADNTFEYLKTKYVRFLMLLALSGYGLSKQTMVFVPAQDFNQKWTDEKLFKKYDLTNEEIEFINSMIKPFDREVDA